MEEKLTPAMKQYYATKKAYPECILFFRMGDFYEMFDEDAEIASKELGLTLTSRNKNAEKPTPLAGFPFHAADRYLAQLTRKGYRIALCEQTSDPKLPGIVQREVVRVVTPGTTLQEDVLDAKKNNYLLSISINTHDGQCALSLCDMSTGSVYLSTRSRGEELRTYLYTTAPAEIISDAPAELHTQCTDEITRSCTTPISYHAPIVKAQAYVEGFYEQKQQHIKNQKISKEQYSSLALLLHYLQETQKQHVIHLQRPHIQQEQGIMRLDEHALRHLELFATSRDGKEEGSLIAFLDHTMTGSGARLLRRWLASPLTSKDEILKRQVIIVHFSNAIHERNTIRDHLKHCYDLERIIARLAMGRGNARDLLALHTTLSRSKDITLLLQQTDATLKHLGQQWEEHTLLSELGKILSSISSFFVDEPPLSLHEGGLIRDGVDTEIDELRYIRSHAQEWLMDYQFKEQTTHDIPTLKVKFNNVFGYFIEISKNHIHKAPEHYIRKQTTVQGERYTTPDLKIYEEKILTAEERIRVREYELFEQVRAQTLTLMPSLLTIASLIAELDVCSALAEVGYKHHYCIPTFTTTGETTIIEGRHPIVEEYLRTQHLPYTPNDCSLSLDDSRFLLLTGPNMAGKSTYMRQIAIITILAQIGALVPATSASLTIKDAVFTRVGASDHVGGGQSTFMVEMEEVSSILRHASRDSLIILDEVGRGTSTYDGLSLAWAIMEYIHTHVGAATIFATHYHELITVASTLPHATNISLAVTEDRLGVRFLHHIIQGGASRSYGIEVGQLAGLPQEIISSARAHLAHLEQPTPHTQAQPSLFDISPATATPSTPAVVYTSHPILEEMKELNLNSMTPIQALNWIMEKKEKL